MQINNNHIEKINNDKKSRVHSDNAIYSASKVDNTTEFCNFDFHFPNPYVDCLVSSQPEKSESLNAFNFKQIFILKSEVRFKYLRTCFTA
jgi:hypothetical protein